MPAVRELDNGHYEYGGVVFKAPNRHTAEGISRRLQIDQLIEARRREGGTVTPQQLKRVKNLIFKEESILRQPVKVMGNPTIGIGRDMKTKGFTPEEKALLRLDKGRDFKQEPLTDAEADALFARDVQDAVSQARELVGEQNYESLDEARQAAFTSLVFQMGKGGVQGFPRFLESFRKGDYETASKELLYKNPAHPNPQPSDLATQTPNRARRTAAAIETGQWPESLPGGGLE